MFPPQQLEIVCIACKCSLDDKCYEQYHEDLPERKSASFRDKTAEFRKKHPHSQCIVRLKKDRYYTEDEEFRNEIKEKNSHMAKNYAQGSL